MKHTKEFNAGVKLAEEGKPLSADATNETVDGYHSVKNPVYSSPEFNAGAKLAKDGKPLPSAATVEMERGWNSGKTGATRTTTAAGAAEYEAGGKLARAGQPLATNASTEQTQGYNDARTIGGRLTAPSQLQKLAGDRERAAQAPPSHVSRGDTPPPVNEGKDALSDNRDAQREYDAGVNLAKQQQNLSGDATDNTRRGYNSVAQPGRPGFATPAGDPNVLIVDVLSVKEVAAAEGQPAHMEIIESGGGRMIYALKGDVEVLPPLVDTPKQQRVKLTRDKFVYR